MPGIFLVLEGIDGSGTTTQAGWLADYLKKQGHDVLLTAEPSEGDVGRLIRDALVGKRPTDDDLLALLFAADRVDHLRREIEPALARDAIVISDRYLLSSLAYQSLELPLAWVQELNRQAREPDNTFLLRVSPATAAARRRERGGEQERFDEQDLQRRVAEGYERALGAPGVGDVFVLDAERDAQAVFAEIQQLADDIVQLATR